MLLQNKPNRSGRPKYKTNPIRLAGTLDGRDRTRSHTPKFREKILGLAALNGRHASLNVASIARLRAGRFMRAGSKGAI